MRSKGASFEREICKYLSLWWTEGEFDDVFWRKRVRSTRKSVSAEFQLGDIKAERPEGEDLLKIFSIELKTGYSGGKKRTNVKQVPWDLLDLIDYRTGSEDVEKKQIIKFWRQCTRDAEVDNKIPLLIFKRDFHKPIVCIHNNTMNSLEDYQGQYEKRFVIFCPDNYTKEQKKLGDKNKDDWLLFFRADDFFEWLDPETVRMMDLKNVRF